MIRRLEEIEVIEDIEVMEEMEELLISPRRHVWGQGA